MYEHILVPLDGSKNSQQALEEACKLAKQFDSTLNLITVINNTNFYYGAGAAGMPPSMYDDQHQIAENIINEAKSMLIHKVLSTKHRLTLVIRRTSLRMSIQTSTMSISSWLVNQVSTQSTVYWLDQRPHLLYEMQRLRFWLWTRKLKVEQTKRFSIISIKIMLNRFVC